MIKILDNGLQSYALTINIFIILFKGIGFKSFIGVGLNWHVY